MQDSQSGTPLQPNRVREGISSVKRLTSPRALQPDHDVGAVATANHPRHVPQPRTETPNTTESLLLRRALGRARPEDYVDWAVDQLGRDVDSPSLRILAGLNVRFDREDIDRYFRSSCDELGLRDLPEATPPLDVAAMIRRAYDQSRIRAEEAIDMLADVHETWEYQEPLLQPWHSMRQELSWRTGYSYPPAALESVERAVATEWSLLDRASRLTLPAGWMKLSRCEHCEHVGPLRPLNPSLLRRLLAALTQPASSHGARCEDCGSQQLTQLTHPDARAAYLDTVERRAGQRAGAL